MSSHWVIIPDALVRARMLATLTAQQVANKALVSMRAYRDYERQEQPIRLATLTALAQVLGVKVTQIARFVDGPSRSRKSDAPKPPSAATRTALETLVDLERAAGIHPEPRVLDGEPIPEMTAFSVQCDFTTFRLRNGNRYCLTGVVDTQRGLPPEEAKLLGARAGTAARFHVLKRIVPDTFLGVTTHAALPAILDGLVSALAHRREVTLVVRLLALDDDPTENGAGFSSFITAIKTPRPWTYVVERILSDEPAPTKRPAKRR